MQDIETFIDELTNDVCAFRMAKKDFYSGKISYALARIRLDQDKLSTEERKFLNCLIWYRESNISI